MSFYLSFSSLYRSFILLCLANRRNSSVNFTTGQSDCVGKAKQTGSVQKGTLGKAAIVHRDDKLAPYSNLYSSKAKEQNFCLSSLPLLSALHLSHDRVQRVSSVRTTPPRDVSRSTSVSGNSISLERLWLRARITSRESLDRGESFFFYTYNI